MSAWPKIKIYDGDMPTPLQKHCATKVFESRPCPLCPNTFTPTGGRQAYCPTCGALSSQQRRMLRRFKK